MDEKIIDVDGITEEDIDEEIRFLIQTLVERNTLQKDEFTVKTINVLYPNVTRDEIRYILDDGETSGEIEKVLINGKPKRYQRYIVYRKVKT